MDIERIQKINKLAVELMQQGLASNRDEAIAQAEKIFKVQEGGSSLQSNQMASNSLQVNPDGSSGSQVAAQQSSQQASTSSGFPREVERILKQNTDFLVKQIKSFQEQMEAMESKLSSLRREMIDLKREVPSRPAASQQQSAAVPRQTNPAPSAPQGSQNNGGGPAKAEHPRSGGYNDEDVSIEKFFYVGHK